MALHTFEELQAIYDAVYMDKVTRNDGMAGIPLAEAIREFYPKVDTIADIGCANGIFMRHFFERGYRIEGYDISVAAWRASGAMNSIIQTVDLREPQAILYKYDLVYAIEFLEHIELEAVDTMLDNICGAAPIILATPGNQPGEGHFNMQPEGWWISKFAEHGFAFMQEKALQFREFLRQPKWDEHQRRFPYMRNGLMVFEHETGGERNDSASAEHAGSIPAASNEEHIK